MCERTRLAHCAQTLLVPSCIATSSAANGPAAARRIPAPVRVPKPAVTAARPQLVLPGAPRKLTVRTAQHLVPAAEPLLEPLAMPGDARR